MTISILLATTRKPRKPRTEPGFPFLTLATMLRTFRQRKAARLTRRQLDVVPKATLKDIGMTRPQVFAGVHGYLSAARP